MMPDSVTSAAHPLRRHCRRKPPRSRWRRLNSGARLSAPTPIVIWSSSASSRPARRRALPSRGTGRPSWSTRSSGFSTARCICTPWCTRWGPWSRPIWPGIMRWGLSGASLRGRAPITFTTGMWRSTWLRSARRGPSTAPHESDCSWTSAGSSPMSSGWVWLCTHWCSRCWSRSFV